MAAADDRRGRWTELEQIVRANEYMVLATADAAGLPWASPVWFATRDCRAFYWASAPGTRHSENLAARPELSIAVFDSSQRPGTGEGVYLSALGGPLPDEELDAGIAIYSAASERAGLAGWSRADVEPPARLRLYRATVREHYLLASGDQRVPVAAP